MLLGKDKNGKQLQVVTTSIRDEQKPCKCGRGYRLPGSSRCAGCKQQNVKRKMTDEALARRLGTA